MLDPHRLIADAEAATGLNDWGAPEFRDGLEQLCAAVRDDDAASLEQQIAVQLQKRLRLYADRATYLEISAQKIVAPIFVVGFPRSGTTILHALLSADPRARSPAGLGAGRAIAAAASGNGFDRSKDCRIPDCDRAAAGPISRHACDGRDAAR